MLKQVMDVWYTRLEAVQEDEESREQAQTMLILDKDGRIPHLQYNRQTQQMEIKPEPPPELPAAPIMIGELKDLVLPHNPSPPCSQKDGTKVPG